MIYWPTKPAVSVRDYGLDWSPLLAILGDRRISTSVWSKLRGTASVAVGTIDPDQKKVYTRVSGGGYNNESVFRNIVTLDDGRVEQVDVFLKTRA
jgi:hypothetical protein